MKAGKFLGPPRGTMDYAWLVRAGKKIDALLNLSVVGEDGAPAGEAMFADGNTVLRIKAQASGAVDYPFAEYSGTPGDYTAGKIVIVSSGTGIGTYGCTATGAATTDPWYGAPDWIQFASNGTGPWL